MSEPVAARLSYPIETADNREFSELSYASAGASSSEILVTSSYLQASKTA